MKVVRWQDGGGEEASTSEPNPRPWCKLISLHRQNPHIVVSQNLCDLANSVFLYRVFDEYAVIELTEREKSVCVNGFPLREKTLFCLNSGDEIQFSSNHSYIFQLLLTTPLTPDKSNLEIVDGKDINISFAKFPHPISEFTRNLLIGSASKHLKGGMQKKSFADTSFMGPRVLLSGPAGSDVYQEKLAKALANCFNAKLLIVGSPQFIIGDKVRYVARPSVTEQRTSSSPRGPTNGRRGTVFLPFNDKVGLRFDKPVKGGIDLGGLCEANHGAFCKVNHICQETSIEAEAEFIDSLFEVIHDHSRIAPLIVFIKDAEKSSRGNFSTFKGKLENLPDNVLIIASHIQDKKLHSKYMTEWMQLFPNRISVVFPEDYSLLKTWKAKVDSEALKRKMEQEVEMIRAEKNLNILSSVFSSQGLEYEGLATIWIKDQILTTESAEKITVLALGHSFMEKLEAAEGDAKPVLLSESIKDAIGNLHASKSESTSYKKSLKDTASLDEHESMLLNDVISPGNLGVRFDDIGAVEHVKKTLKDVMVLSLQRTELFTKGQLAKPIKGILLFGPQGVEKRTLAESMATETRSNFINFSITKPFLEWKCDGETYVKTVFSLAKKLSPSIIFMDQDNSQLLYIEGEKGNVNILKMRMAFWACWKDLRAERVLVMAATSTPSRLTSDIVRLLPCRLMVDLPNLAIRKKMLKVILAKQKNVSADVDLDSVAKMTEGYSATDLEKVCKIASFRPMGETLEKEMKYLAAAVGEGSPVPILYGSDEIRPLLMADFIYSLKQVSPSVPAMTVKELQEWDDLYGDSDSRARRVPSYYY